MGWRQRSAGQWDYGRQRAWGSGGSSPVRSRDWWCGCGWGNPNHHRYCGKRNTPWWVKQRNSSNKVDRPQRWEQGPPAWLQNIRVHRGATVWGPMLARISKRNLARAVARRGLANRPPRNVKKTRRRDRDPHGARPSAGPVYQGDAWNHSGHGRCGFMGKLLSEMLAQCEDNPQTLTPEEAAKQLRSLLDRHEDRLRKKVANEQNLEYLRARCQKAEEKQQGLEKELEIIERDMDRVKHVLCLPMRMGERETPKWAVRGATFGTGRGRGDNGNPPMAAQKRGAQGAVAASEPQPKREKSIGDEPKGEMDVDKKEGP